tara:strand:- start:64 stop:522 length:459 start_codon:yes stop_codon:yes gene_type:complete
MGKIKPTFTLTANSSSASNDPGPLSVALSLSATDTLDVDRAQSEIKEVGDSVLTILDGSALLAIDSDNGTAGLHGGFVYMKNVTASDLDVYIGFNVADGTTAATDDLDAAARGFTLKQDEFAWVPWDCTGDITARGEGACKIEYWFFNRSNA